jgi:hypothetical protein
MSRMLGAAQATLLVLPKWRGDESPTQPGFIVRARPLPVANAALLLEIAGVATSVVRPASPEEQTCSGAATSVTLLRPQLLEPSRSLRPLIDCPGGVLLGEARVKDRRVIVLSDPDLLSNHGLLRGQNAALALGVVELARQQGQNLVLDETLHGHEWVPSLWRELLRFPLLLAVIQVALILAVLLWAGMAHFGAPLSAATALAAGKTVLIDNTAALLRSAGHSGHTVGRYFDAGLQDVARALHAPAAATPAELRGWLTRVARARGVRIDLRGLEEQVDRVRGRKTTIAAPVLAAAARVHRWRKEMLGGAQQHPGR